MSWPGFLRRPILLTPNRAAEQLRSTRQAAMSSDPRAQSTQTILETLTIPDLRPLLFAGARWYETLEEPGPDEESAWYVAKSPEPFSWPTKVLSAAAAFAVDHGILPTYRARFAGVRAIDITAKRAERERRNASTKIWEIAHELIAGRFLERVLGWEFLQHEPAGAENCRGEWEFRTNRGRTVFVEVKTVAEREYYENTGAFSRGPKVSRIESLVRRAYPQLPDDGRANLVILAGREIFALPAGILHGDLFQAMFGRMEVRFEPLSDDKTMRRGPSRRGTLVNQTKNRRVGCIAGLRLVGLDLPEVQFHAIDNPYATDHCRLLEDELANAHRFVVDAAGRGEARKGLPLQQVWKLMVAGIDHSYLAALETLASGPSV